MTITRGQLTTLVRDAFAEGFKLARDAAPNEPDLDDAFDRSMASYEVGNLDLSPTAAEVVAYLRAQTPTTGGPRNDR